MSRLSISLSLSTNLLLFRFINGTNVSDLNINVLFYHQLEYPPYLQVNIIIYIYSHRLPLNHDQLSSLVFLKKNISIMVLPFIQLWRTFIYVYIFEQRVFIIKIILQKKYFYGKTLKFLIKRTERLSMKFMNQGVKSFYLSQGQPHRKRLKRQK